MIACRANVLPVETAEQQNFNAPLPGMFQRIKSDDYRRIVSQIILEIEAEKDWNDERLAEEVGCSAGTIKNARLKKGNLDAVTMLNLGVKCGGSWRLKPVLALVNGNPDVAPESPTEKRKRLLRELQALED